MQTLVDTVKQLQPPSTGTRFQIQRHGENALHTASLVATTSVGQWLRGCRLVDVGTATVLQGSTGWHRQSHADCQAHDVARHTTLLATHLGISWAPSQGYIGGRKLPERWWHQLDWERLLWMLIRGSIGPIPTFPPFQMDKFNLNWKTGWAQAVSLSEKLRIDPNSHE